MNRSREIFLRENFGATMVNFGGAASSSVFGNLSLLTDVASHSGAIGTSLSGVTLIPEPPGPALLIVLVLTITARRRRKESRRALAC